MNKAELITAMAEVGNLSKKDCEAALNAFIEVTQSTLKSGDKVQLIGFGTFEVKHREAHMGRNPATGEAIEIQASNTPTFKAGQVLKDAVK